jgi:predicted dehydrogenase
MTNDEHEQIGDRQSTVGNKSVRWGLIGCGDIAQKRVAPALVETQHSELVGVSRANTDLLDEFADKFNVLHRFADWNELVRCKDIDAVYVATPVNLHAVQTMRALESGKHVLCEKPMALNVADCDRMISAAKAARRQARHCLLPALLSGSQANERSDQFGRDRQTGCRAGHSF